MYIYLIIVALVVVAFIAYKYITRFILTEGTFQITRGKQVFNLYVSKKSDNEIQIQFVGNNKVTTCMGSVQSNKLLACDGKLIITNGDNSNLYKIQDGQNEMVAEKVISRVDPYITGKWVKVGNCPVNKIEILNNNNIYSFKVDDNPGEGFLMVDNSDKLNFYEPFETMKFYLSSNKELVVESSRGLNCIFKKQN